MVTPLLSGAMAACKRNIYTFFFVASKNKMSQGMTKPTIRHVTSKDSVQPPSMERVLIYPSLDNPEIVEGTCNQQRL